MKFNFKKVASVIASAVMLTSTVGFAAASTYPAPFTSGAAVVYGAAGQATDMAAAISISNDLNGKITTTSTTTTVGTSGGDSVNLGTSSRRVYYGDSINAARSSLSASEMPNVLADGKVLDLKGTEYKYTQSILPGDTVSVFGTSGGDVKDPILHLDVGTTAGDPLYNYTLSFSKNINVSDDTNVQGQKIKMLGVDYVIGASSTNTTLYLYGAGETVNMNGGESKTVTIAGKEHTVDFVGATTTTTAKIAVDGVSKTVTKGASYSFAGDINVYVKDVTYQAYAGGVQSAELIVGANTLLIQNGQAVKIGADATTVKGTSATITAAGVGLISKFTVSEAMQTSQKDHIAAGSSFADTVFGGLKVTLAGVMPELNSTARASIKANTDNNQYAKLTFTSARDGGKGEYQFTYAVDNNTAAATVQPFLAHQTLSGGVKGRIHVVENESAYENDWIVINQGDSGTILNVDTISVDTETSASVTFSDVITGESQKQVLTLNDPKDAFVRTGVNFYGGNGYIITLPNTATTSNNTVAISWSASNTTAVYPRIKLKDGGWISLLESVTIANNSAVIFPDGQTTLSTTRTTLDTATDQSDVRGVIWGIKESGTSAIIENISTSDGVCIFNSTRGPAILYFEPKKWNDASYGNFICVPLTTTGTDNVYLSLSQPYLNGTDSGFVTYDSDVYKKAAVDVYGAFVQWEDRASNEVATILTPSSQMYLDVLFTADSTTVTPGSTTSAGGAVSIITDKQVGSYQNSNLIVVGGSCVNEVAAKLLDSTTPVCGADFTTKTTVGAGHYIIKTFASPYADGKVAMLVAGYEAAETTLAAAKVLEGADTTVGAEDIEPKVTA